MDTEARTFESITAELRTLRAGIEARREHVPNLRDYGLSNAARERYETDIAAYHAETTRLADRMQALGYERLALPKAR